MEHTDWPVETSQASNENIDQTEQHYNEITSEASVTHTKIKPCLSTVCTKQFIRSSHPNGRDKIHKLQKP